jgi:hypothetical protein
MTEYEKAKARYTKNGVPSRYAAFEYSQLLLTCKKSS